MKKQRPDDRAAVKRVPAASSFTDRRLVLFDMLLGELENSDRSGQIIEPEGCCELAFLAIEVTSLHVHGPEFPLLVSAARRIDEH